MSLRLRQNVVLGATLLFPLWSCVPKATAQSEQPWQYIEDLPASVTTAVLQDKDGFIWVGTYVGLAYSDGIHTDVFRPSSSTSGSISNAVVNIGALLLDRQGSNWIGTRDGLCKREPTSTLFNCIGDASSPESFVNSNIAALAEGPDGTIWVGTPNGLYTVDSATLSARQFEEAYAPKNSWISALAVEEDGTIWVGTPTGLAVRHPSSSAFVSVAGMPDTLVQAIEISQSGEVWVGTMGQGLFRVEDDADRVTHIALGSRVGGQMPISHIVALDTDQMGHVWIGTWGDGLLVYDPVAKTSRQFRSSAGSSSGLPADEVVDVSIDERGGVWVATWGGVAYLPPSPPFRFLTHRAGDPYSLSNPRVTRIVVGPTGELWVGTFDGGLNKCDPETLTCEQYRHDPSDPSTLCNDSVLDLGWQTDGSLWVATSGAGICRFDTRTEKFDRPLDRGPVSLATEHVYSMALAVSGESWIGTAEHGLAKMNHSTGETEFVAPFSRTSVYALASAGPKHLWVGTLGRGLCQLDAGDAFQCLRAEADGLSDDWVTTLATAINGVWAGGTSGLDWIPEGGQPQRVLSDRQLNRPHVTCVLPTASGTWVATASGILRLDPDTHQITHDATIAGFPARGFLRPACAEIRHDLVAFGTENGVLLFDPADVMNASPPPIRITAVRVDGTDAAPGSRADLTDIIRIGPNQGGPTLRFASLSFNSLEARRYVCRLDGLEQEWSRPSGSSEITYPKLPPGRYTFRVRPAMQPDANEATVELLVLAPFWKRPWFFLLAAIVLSSIGFAIFRARVQYLLGIERTRVTIADDLHDDIGSRLSGLALGLDVAAKNPSVASPTILADRAEEARSILGDLRDTTWIVGDTHETLAKLADRIQQVAETLLPGVSVTMTRSGALNQNVGMEVRRQVLFFCKEVLHNTSRHGSATMVNISLAMKADRSVCLTISDDGRGFTMTTFPGRGLASLKRRSEAIGGAFQITSAPGEGTTVSLSF